MKKILILFLTLIFIPVIAMSSVKKVAILEPVDREGNISYAYKLILRANLSKAITNTDGYEAYDRTDIDAIMSEQNFQRTGMVSDDQIRQLGEMTGAMYILVAEAAKVDETNMFITAKILNVETAKTEMTDNVLMTTSPSDIQHGCESLANKLLGIRTNITKSGSTSTINNKAQTTETINKELKPVQNTTPAPVKNTTNNVPARKWYVPKAPVVMYGVDYSHVQLRGVSESFQQYISIFSQVNAIYNKEPDKYNFSKLVGKNTAVYTTPMDELIQHIDWGYAMSGGGIPQVKPVAEIIKKYNLPHTEGVGMVFIAWLLDRTEAKTFYDVVLFDIKDRRIIFNTTVSAEAGGFYPRNFWANSVCEVIENKKLSKQIKALAF
ncbi:MAG: hypothetical protein IJ341_05955 [Bacteroidales bacterium]|nr:hypothetical protein [Bacteroidales bacterium]